MTTTHALLAEEAVTPQTDTIEEPILQAVNISKKYSNGFLALRDVNFTVSDIKRPGYTQGQVWSILGKSGAGKTTLAKIIAGHLSPTTGQVLLNYEKRPIKRGEVGFVFQNSIVFGHLTVKGNLLLAAYQGLFRQHADQPLFEGIKNSWQKHVTWLFGKKILWEKVEQYLDAFDLRGQLNNYPHEISGGQRQRLAILSQVLCSNLFMCLDEPFSGQDSIRKQETCEALIKVAQLDDVETLMIITHDVDCALRVSDTLMLMGIQRDPVTKEAKPGSTVFKPYDLAADGLAWQDKSICRTTAFNKLVQEIKYDWLPSVQ